LNKLGVFVMGEMIIIEEPNSIDKMAQAKLDAEQYINQKK
jgi:hypothetical protein